MLSLSRLSTVLAFSLMAACSPEKPAAVSAPLSEAAPVAGPWATADAFSPEVQEAARFAVQTFAVQNKARVLYKDVTQARQQVVDCEVKLSAERAETVPKVFTKLHLHFEVTGINLSDKQVERAVQLSADKYCSVSIMLSGSVAITHSFSLIPADINPAAE